MKFISDKEKRAEMERIDGMDNETLGRTSGQIRTTRGSLLLTRWLAPRRTPCAELETGGRSSMEDRTLEFAAPPSIEEPDCYSIPASKSCFTTDKMSCASQVNKDTIRNLLVDHMRYVGGRLQLLEDLEGSSVDAVGNSAGQRIAKSCKKREINALLLYASFIGRADLVSDLHSHGARLNYSEHERGVTALHLCAFSNCLNGVKYLLTNGCKVKFERTSHTPFHYAAFGDALEVAQYFLERGISQESPIGEETVLHAAARTGAVSVLKLLAPRNGTLDRLDCRGYGAIHYAAERGEPAGCLTALLEAGCQVDLVTKKGDTALHFAAEASCSHNVDLLIEKGANVNLTNQRGQTVLHIASRSHSLECAEILLRKGGCDPNAEDNDGRTPVHLALGRSIVAHEVTETLLTWGADGNKADRYGYTPLHIAALNELSRCVDALIRHGANLGAKIKGGTSALSIILRKTPTSLNVFKQSLDASITLHQHGSATGEVELRLDFHPLLVNRQQGELDYLGTFIEEGYKEILEHPLCQSFLHLKWQKIRKYYAGRLVFYLFYVLTMTGWVMTALAHNCYNESHGQLYVSRVPLCGANTTGINGAFYRHPGLLVIEWYALVAFTVLETLRKLTGIATYLSLRHFFVQAENIVDWCVILSAFATSFVYAGRTYPWQSHIGAFAVLCGWSNLMLMIGQLPIFGAYVAMFTSVQVQVFKLLLAYACLLVGFTASFCVIFPRSKSFSSPHTGLIKVLVMMTGELNFEDLFFPAEEDGKTVDAGSTSWILLQVSAQLSFVLFLLFVTIVLMNLLIGIAVHDIKGLQKTAGLAKLVRQTKLIRDVEAALFLSHMPNRVMRLLRWTALVLPSPLRAVLIVRPLNPRETRLPKDVLSDAHKIAVERKIISAQYTLPKRKSSANTTTTTTITSYTYLKSDRYSTLRPRTTGDDGSADENKISHELVELRKICEKNHKLLQDLVTALAINRGYDWDAGKDERNQHHC